MELFPETDRVIYRRNPLAQVSCRVRFGELLEIRAGEPVEFHQAIRDTFPMVDRQRLSDEDKTVLREFISPEGAWKVRLAPHLLEITTNEYERWEDFSKTAFRVLGAFRDCYALGRFTRIDLRYIDVLQRQPLGLDHEWHELLNDEITGPMLANCLPEKFKGYNQSLDFVLDPQRQSMARLELAITELDEPPGEFATLIDLDLFQPNPRSPKDAEETLDHLHEYSGRIFRGCISERLHQALEPQPVENTDYD
jgi:uncharacterized protein (TIGR04255 family)